MTASHPLELLTEGLARGATVLVPTQRLQRAVLRRYNDAQADRGQRCWPTAQVLPFSAWLRAAWESTWQDRAVAPDAVSLALWEKVIGRDAKGRDHELLDVAATATQAREASALICLYEIEVPWDTLSEPEHRAMGRWYGAHGEELAAGGWIDRSTLPVRVADLTGGGELPAPAELLLFGFDELPPAWRTVLRRLEERGTAVRTVGFPQLAGRAVRFAAPDPREEVRACARWLRGLLAAGVEPERVGVVAGGLEDYGVWVEQIFAEEMDPASVLPGHAADTPLFDVSYGTALSREPIVATALELLGIESAPLPWEFWSSLLRSPFWGGTEDGFGRERLAESLSRSRSTRWDTAGVQECARQSGLTATADCLSHLDALARRTQERLPVAHWVEVFAEVLRTAAWSRARSLNSREHQAVEKFRQALGALRQFDCVGDPLGRTLALTQARHLCAEPFRVEVPEGRVRVMGLLEAAGLEFDHLWVLGLRADVLPPPARANPLLPQHLQMACGVRQANPSLQATWAAGVFARLLSAAETSIVSYPSVWDGVATQPSPLALGLGPADLQLGPSSSAVAQLREKRAPLEGVGDRAPPMDDAVRVRGGAGFLARQAACPFQAFAAYRLLARGPQAPDQALDPLERGIGVHEALCHLWGRVGSHAELSALGAAGRERLVAESARAGIRSLEDGSRGLSPRLVQLERLRIERLLREWLTLELEREPFRVVGREESREVTVGGLCFAVRIDRVDETADGKRILIDYKTGRPKPTEWCAERPLEPQLPLYALACPEGRGICYAVVRPGECSLDALRETNAGLEAPGRGLDLPANWEEMLTLWRQRLGVLAGEARAGRAAVAPVEDRVCRYCELPALCRVRGPVREEDE